MNLVGHALFEARKLPSIKALVAMACIVWLFLVRRHTGYCFGQFEETLLNDFLFYLGIALFIPKIAFILLFREDEEVDVAYI